MEETYPPLIRDWWLMTLVDICFLKLGVAALEQALGIQMEFFAITTVLGTKKDISFLKGVRSKWKSPSGYHEESEEKNVCKAAIMSQF